MGMQNARRGGGAFRTAGIFTLGAAVGSIVALFYAPASGQVTRRRLANRIRTLRLELAMSAALIASVKELRLLTDEQAQMVLPLVVSGRMPRVAVMPDVQYVASKLFTTTARQLLGRALQRALER